MKTARKLFVVLVAALAVLAPQSAVAAEVTEVHAHFVNGTYVWDQTEFDKLRGDTYYLDLPTMTITAGYSGRSVIARRGCSDGNAACWLGGGGVGEMQFSGTGTINGHWPYRGNFIAGDRDATITFKTSNGFTISTPTISRWRDMTISPGVIGLAVTRW